MSSVATPEVEEAVKALIAGITTVEEAEELSQSLDLLFTSWGRFYSMLEREGLEDFLNFRVEGSVVDFRLNTSARVHSPWTADGKNLETYLTFMKLQLKPTYVGDDINLFVSKTLNTIYDANSALTVLMLKYCTPDDAHENNNALEMYTDIFEKIIYHLKKDFTKFNVEFNSENLSQLFIVLFFQQSGNLANTSVEDVLSRMNKYQNLGLLSYSLQPLIYRASDGVLLEEDFIRNAKGMPIEWVVSILTE